MRFIFTFLFVGFSISSFAQSIVGSWQLMKKMECSEENLPATDPATDDLVDEMKSMGNKTPLVVQFKANMTGEESARVFHKKQSETLRTFLYKVSGSTLFILDKKSHTVIDTYTMESSAADSLILSNTSRPCEMKIFVKIK